MEAIFLEGKNQIFEPQRPQNSSGNCDGLWFGQIWFCWGECDYSVTMLMLEAVHTGAGGRVEGFGGGGKSERSWRQLDDHL